MKRLVMLMLVGCASAGGTDSTASGAQHPLIGSPAPAFTLDTANAKGKFDIAKVKGKVVVVDFWATWCDPCKKSFPKLQDLYTKYNASGMELVGISEDEENSGITEFGNAHGAKFPLAWDSGKSIAGQWQPKSMPTTFVVDRNGIVRFAHLGYHDGDEAEMEKEVKSLL
jgi:peroxiredoxin